MKRLIPLAAFVVLVVFLGVGLLLDPSKVPSPLIDKPAPAFALPQLHNASETISNSDMRGQVWLFNVWASWCVSCRQEHPLLVELARRNIVPIIGLNYKDERNDAIRWLQDLGNPYTKSGHDIEGRVGMDYGVYGVPETYVIDQQGTIRFKQIGPISPDALQNEILPLIEKLQGI